MKVSYNVPSSAARAFASEGQLRGYDDDVTQQYVRDRKRVYKQHAPLSDAIIYASIAALAGKIALNAHKAKISFIDAAKKQFQPLKDAFNYCIVKEGLDNLEHIDSQNPPTLKIIGNKFKSIARIGYRGLEGIWHSIPGKIKWPGLFLLTFIQMSSIMEKNKVDAKCDTLQFIKDHRIKKHKEHKEHKEHLEQKE